MSTPVEIKCVYCVHFENVEEIPFEDGLFKFICSAYLNGIPENIRSWESPHILIRSDQVGKYVFSESIKKESNEYAKGDCEHNFKDEMTRQDWIDA